MRNVFVILASLCAAFPAAADVYKWVDSEGKIHYSDTPPAKGASKAIDLPKAVVESKPAESPAVEQKPRAEPVPAAAAPQAPPAPAPQASRGMPFDVYIMLRNGMSEGELMQRAGPPDYESTDGTVGSAVVSGRKRNRVESFNNLELRKLYYYPTQSDPFTTVVTLTGGMISDLQRTRKF